jgi:hypothetical protein
MFESSVRRQGALKKKTEGFALKEAKVSCLPMLLP